MGFQGAGTIIYYTMYMPICGLCAPGEVGGEELMREHNLGAVEIEIEWEPGDPVATIIGCMSLKRSFLQ